ncbi:hypothetical protein CIT292_09916 [Citrobacter youngae ATCC 29220]|uniref:Uncharacterized protein n=1 Tax=Citrobacter youngae ATCC 29220 TaxID=500640 RepID=D4BHA9_9ENTR|nr:hypothetical protein CIT292_09916 [Citrobacter youngae ATCC 29220]
MALCLSGLRIADLRACGQPSGNNLRLIPIIHLPFSHRSAVLFLEKQYVVYTDE